MGVEGLWSLLGPTSRPVRLQAMAGEKVAVDASIWLFHFTKAMRDPATGEMLPNAHILGFFRRLCKLLFFGIKPVFVFDGSAPELKLRTIRERRRRQQGNSAAVDKTRKKLVTAKLKQFIIQSETTKANDNIDDMNDPLLPSPGHGRGGKRGRDDYELPTGTGVGNDTGVDWDLVGLGEISLLDDAELQSIDLDSVEFRSLPRDIQQEILRELRIRSRQTSWDRFNHMVDKSKNSALDFSLMQIQNLVKRNEIWERWNNSQRPQVADGKSTTLGRIAAFNDREYMLVKNTDNATWTLQSGAEAHADTESTDVHSVIPVENEDESRVAVHISDEEELEVFEVVQPPKKSNHAILRYIESSDEESTANGFPETFPIDNELSSQKPKASINIENSIPGFIYETERLDAKVKIDEVVVPIVKIPIEVHPDEDSLEKQSLDLNNETLIEVMEVVTNKEAMPEKKLTPELERVEEEFVESESDEAEMKKEGEHFASLFSSMLNKDANEVTKELEQEIENLRQQHHIHKRDAATISSDMIDEVKMLLDMFGVPYVVSLTEAEAQCAYMKINGIVDAIVSDDSDIFLFGGDQVYKNMFNQSKYVESYSIRDISSITGATRNILINLAYLLGSDYCTGITGVGPVGAMEIVAEFADKDDGNEGIGPLEKFAQWIQDVLDNRPSETHAVFTKKYGKQAVRWFSDGFPSEKPYDGYMNPQVDQSIPKLEWKLPNIISIRKFMQDRLEWDSKKVDEIVLPLIKNMSAASARLQQASMEKYMVAFKSDADINTLYKKTMASSILKLRAKLNPEPEPLVDEEGSDFEHDRSYHVEHKRAKPKPVRRKRVRRNK